MGSLYVEMWCHGCWELFREVVDIEDALDEARILADRDFRWQVRDKQSGEVLDITLPSLRRKEGAA